MPSGGGGVTDFLALTDTPDTYTGFGSETDTEFSGAVVGVNQGATALEFRWSTSEITDIRDYGTVVDGGDITVALQAAITAIDTGVIRQRRVLVPRVGGGDYTCGALTFPSGDALILDLDVPHADGNLGSPVHFREPDYSGLSPVRRSDH